MADVVDEREALFEASRPQLEALVYRMVGTIDDAQDVVQETWLRFAGLEVDTSGAILNPEAWLTTVATRIAIDTLRSARKRREHYVGPWLPEPVLNDDSARVEGTVSANAADPADHAVLCESLTLGFLAVLERLGPTERAVFLLHDVFAYPHAEVAEMVDRSEAATRQIARRARARVAEGRPRFDATVDQAETLTEQFFGAVLLGDLVGLQDLLADDIVILSDGGAARRAARNPIIGPDRCARFLIGVTRTGSAKRLFDGSVETVIDEMTVNGQPGFLIRAAGSPEMLMVLNWVAGQVTTVSLVLNPDKLPR